MSESSASLAIIERKPKIQRPGGCVGIFFQLFDWNRRFARKKFFPKKLLPPARTKVSKKFNADDKLPGSRHLLIADENSGGFPSKMMKKKKKKSRDCKLSLEPKKQEMQAPGLVARLMGLDALPVNVDQSGKSSPKDDEFRGKGVNFNGACISVDSSPDKGNVRPQKLQRTGVVERRPVARFGAEALQIKNVLTRSRKNHHHPKLAPPVKSPKMGRNASRLIDAAARILEPGIQATSRARCSLSYPSSMMQPYKEDKINEVKGRANVDVQNQFNSTLSDAQVPNSESDCHSCGNVFGRVDVASAVEGRSRDFDAPASDFRERFFCELEESRPRPVVYLENKSDVVLLKTRHQPDPTASQTEDNIAVQNAPIRNGMHPSKYYDQIPMSRVFTSQRDTQRSVGLKHRLQRPGQMLVGDRIPPKPNLANTQCRRVSSPVNYVTKAKDFIAINRNISQSRPRAQSKPESSSDGYRRFQTGKNDPMATQRNPVRKRRTPITNRQADNAASSSSQFERQRSNKGNAVIGNAPRIRASTVNQSGLQSRSVSQRGNNDATRTDVVSFTFNSPVRSSAGAKSHNELGVRRRDPKCSFNEENLQQQSMMEENDTDQPSHRYLQINGDAVGVLLEQKLKELTNQAENEAAAGFVPSARTTASILQELISALTVERPVTSEGRDHGSDRKDSECSEVLDSSSQQAISNSKRPSTGLSCDVDHFSPGCVLDASFSTESCASSSSDDVSVKLGFTDADLSDSASSTKEARISDISLVTDLLNHTSAILQNVNCVHGELTATKRDHVQEIVLNAELLFGKAGLQSSSRFVDFLLGPFLDELETLVLAAWKTSIILGIEIKKEENPLRRFLIDCLIECLDVKYSRFIKSGFRSWSRLPKSLDAEVLIRVFDEEIRKWISFSGKTTDEIIEREMTTSLGKWTDFEIEAFETGEQINQDIVQSLVDEIVSDLGNSEISCR